MPLTATRVAPVHPYQTLADDSSQLERYLSVQKWSVADVGKWIGTLAELQQEPKVKDELIAFVPNAAEHLIGGEELMVLNRKHLKDAGITKVGVAIRLLAARDYLMLGPIHVAREPGWIKSYFSFIGGTFALTSRKDVAGTREELILEYTNMGLLAALLVSVLLSVGASDMSFMFVNAGEHAEWALQVLILLVVEDVMLFFLSMLLSVYGLVFINETSNDLELLQFLDIVGSSTTRPLRFLMLGIVLAGLTLLWACYWYLQLWYFVTFLAISLPLLVLLTYFLVQWTKFLYRAKIPSIY